MLKCSNELMSCKPIRAKKALKCDQMAPCVLVIGANDEDRGRHLTLKWLLVRSSCVARLYSVSGVPSSLFTHFHPYGRAWVGVYQR